MHPDVLPVVTTITIVILVIIVAAVVVAVMIAGIENLRGPVPLVLDDWMRLAAVVRTFRPDVRIEFLPHRYSDTPVGMAVYVTKTDQGLADLLVLLATLDLFVAHVIAEKSALHVCLHVAHRPSRVARLKELV